MHIDDLASDQVVLQEIGNRLGGYRLAQNLTQKDLAERAGVSLSTLARLEDGQSANTLNLIRVLRALGLLDNLEVMLPSPEPSPLELLKHRGKKRQRASRPRKEETEPQKWGWGDEK